jgi:hypothetical protein
VCADIDDFREMATGEDMAIRFYKKGDAADLAQQFVAILQSPELQRQMAEHNFATGVEMTMASVVKTYLRWFELSKYKRAVRNTGALSLPRRIWLRVRKGQKGATWMKSQSGSISPQGNSD